VLVNETNYFSSPKMIASSQNEADTSYGLSGDKSVQFNIVMSTTNDALSPIIDTHRTSLVAVQNKVNNPSETNMNVANLDYNTILSANTNIAFTAATQRISSSNSTAKAALATLTVGKYLVVTGDTPTANNQTYLITEVASDGSYVTLSGPNAIQDDTAGDAITLVQRERFASEIAPTESSTYSKYVTKKINLANHSNYLRVKFAANIPADASVEVWYKTNIVGSNTAFENAKYTQMTVDSIVPNSSNQEGKFYDASYSLDDLVSFDAIQIKLVMKSTNSSEVPRIKDLRVIACV